ncbi:NAD(P)-dependent oxidoreductase [Clostridium sp. LIBA-8841]|uniref:NAD(P)-dependent oxidoreductase n=1 Tax=Clostridium sp. LIBA-8841 TaxID=2987530 RepID=UPI002AC4AEEF|nr:NAD(P)-dependent oxidoreductase [Clostridium sp. LIBA-8841]MDZ5252179.1 NAD(P)-dependent oxidoreductase [Clostridium sp. LIBA-8841]
MVGDSSTKRKKQGDFYETPKWAIEALLKREGFDGMILEPCCGKGAISKVLEEYGYKVKSSDIAAEDNIYGEKGIDVLLINKVSDNIITNPPYNRNILNKIVEHLSTIYVKKMALLLRLTFLEGEGRRELLSSLPLKSIYVFSSRVTMYPENEEKPKNSGTTAYAWFVWEKGYVGQPVINWIYDKECK